MAGLGGGTGHPSPRAPLAPGGDGGGRLEETGARERWEQPLQPPALAFPPFPRLWGGWPCPPRPGMRCQGTCPFLPRCPPISPGGEPAHGHPRVLLFLPEGITQLLCFCSRQPAARMWGWGGRAGSRGPCAPLGTRPPRRGASQPAGCQPQAGRSPWLGDGVGRLPTRGARAPAFLRSRHGCP